MKRIICTDIEKCLSYIKQKFKNLEECYSMILFLFMFVDVLKFLEGYTSKFNGCSL